MSPEKTFAGAARLSVAPMMEWTDRHCRVFHRILSRRVLLYTEMVTAMAVSHGDTERLIGFCDVEQPVALQLGGSDPAQLAKAALIGADRGYREINLNCGCPSDRVQSGCFGAVLMERPDLVAEAVAAMIAAVPGTIEVTVKCRIGVDDQDPREALPRFLQAVAGTGVRRVTIHARKAWLKGLSPKENREVPPLDYPLVAEMVGAFPQLSLSLNGGIGTLVQAQEVLALGMAGAMVGRAAYHAPYDILSAADAVIFGEGTGPRVTRVQAVHEMLPYIAAHLAGGGRLHQITRHMLGLFHGQPGARSWRRVLSEGASASGAGTALVLQALDHVEQAMAA